MSGRSGANLHYTQTPRHGEQQAYKQLCVDAVRAVSDGSPVRFVHPVFLCSAVSFREEKLNKRNNRESERIAAARPPASHCSGAAYRRPDRISSLSHPASARHI